MSEPWRDALASERARRGLPDYARPAPKPVRAAPVDGGVRYTCKLCSEEMPEDFFRWAGNAFPKGKVCNACYEETYGKRRTADCSSCGKRIRTRRGDGLQVCSWCSRVKDAKCIGCGTVFKPKRSATSRFCTHECYSANAILVRKSRRPCVGCGAVVITENRVESPRCQTCRRAALGLGPRQPGEGRTEYWRARVKRAEGKAA